jgi:hypothetical protein
MRMYEEWQLLPSSFDRGGKTSWCRWSRRDLTCDDAMLRNSMTNMFLDGRDMQRQLHSNSSDKPASIANISAAS